MGAMSSKYNDSPEKASRAYDADRDGFVIAGGAGIVVLEDYEHALRRGAHIYAEVIGYGATSDGHDMVAPSGEGAMRCMQQALTTVDTPIDYINAHGTGTPHNDAAESHAVRDLLGERAGQVPMSSIKSMVGHTLGAAGAIEAVASVLSLLHGVLPPTKNLRDPETEFGLDYIPELPRHQQVEVVLSSSFAFGGNNAALLFGRG